MGKALRSNSKKSVKRSRREILKQTCQSVEKAELKKQAILQKILDAPKPVFEESANRNKEHHLENSNEVPEASTRTDRPFVNVTLMNSQRRHKRRLRHLHRNPRLHTFLITESEKKKVAKERERSDSTSKIESNIGLRSVRKVEARTVVMQDIKPVSNSYKRHDSKALPQGSQWLKIKKMIRSKQPRRKPIRRRYRHVLKGITQYYPLKKAESMEGVNEQM